MKDPTPPSVQTATVAAIRRSDFAWNPSQHTQLSPGWEYARLNGTKRGPYTLLCRCGVATTYVPWVSDQPVEVYVIGGEMTVNGVSLGEGDYALVPAGTDGRMSSNKGMEALSVAHGRVVKSDSILKAIADDSISDDEAEELVKLPWVDHLRRNVSDQQLPILVSALSENRSPRVAQLCISIARGLASGVPVESVAKLLETTDDLSSRVTCILYLASKGKMSPANWTEQLRGLRVDPGALLQEVRKFYAAKDNQELLGVIAARRQSGKYQYNEPFYELVVELASENA